LFEWGLCAVLLIAAIARWKHPGTASERPVGRWLAGVFFVSLLLLLIVHQIENPSWTPHGADWDSWYHSAVSFRRDLAVHPPNRWPLFGALGALVSLVVPGSVFFGTQVSVAIAAAGAAAGIYLLGHHLIGRSTGLAAAALALTLPCAIAIAGWTSAYSLWAACIIWSLAGLAAALQTGRHRWWLVSGIATAGIFATMEKGLGPGLALLLPATVGLLLYGRPLRRATAAFVAPIVLLGMLYAAFPSPLVSLDSRVRAAVVHQPAETIIAGPQGEADYAEGYIFGKSSGPGTILTTLRTILQGDGEEAPSPATQNAPGGFEMLASEMPGMSPFLGIWLLGSGLGIVLIGLMRREQRWKPLTWAGVALASGSIVIPTLMLNYETKILLPFFNLAPLLLLAPIGILSAKTAGPWRAIPLLIPLLALLPGSPWRAPSGWRLHVDVTVPVSGLQLYYGLKEQALSSPLTVILPPSVSSFALDAQPGTMHPLSLDQRFFTEGRDTPPVSSHHLLILAGSPEGGAWRRERDVLWELPAEDDQVFRLLSPQAP
jgi:hypothetical protein